MFVREKLRDRVYTVSIPQLVLHVPSQSLPKELGGCADHDHASWLKQCAEVSARVKKEAKMALSSSCSQPCTPVRSHPTLEQLQSLPCPNTAANGENSTAPSGSSVETLSEGHSTTNGEPDDDDESDDHLLMLEPPENEDDLTETMDQGQQLRQLQQQQSRRSSSSSSGRSDDPPPVPVIPAASSVVEEASIKAKVEKPHHPHHHNNLHNQAVGEKTGGPAGKDELGMSLSEFIDHVRSKGRKGLYHEYEEIKSRDHCGSFENSR